MNPMQDIPLRDIHAAPAVPWWPPAPGWWLLAAIVLGLVIWVTVYLMRRWRQSQLRRSILRELSSLRESYEDSQDRAALAQGLSSFARRLALFTDGPQVSGLHGSRWLSYLDETSGTRDFTQGVGKILLAAPYQAAPDYEPGDLVDVMQSWAERMVRKVVL